VGDNKKAKGGEDFITGLTTPGGLQGFLLVRDESRQQIMLPGGGGHVQKEGEEGKA